MKEEGIRRLHMDTREGMAGSNGGINTSETQ